MTRILDPTLSAASAAVVTLPRAVRPARLDGGTLGLLANGKSNGMALLDHVARLLSARHRIAGVVRVAKTNASAPVSEEDAERLAARASAIVTAIGD